LLKLVPSFIFHKKSILEKIRAESGRVRVHSSQVALEEVPMLIHRSLYKGIAKEWATLIIRLGANGKKFKLYRIRVSGTLKPLKINSYNPPKTPLPSK
jgi:hypothetical protein